MQAARAAAEGCTQLGWGLHGAGTLTSYPAGMGDELPPAQKEEKGMGRAEEVLSLLLDGLQVSDGVRIQGCSAGPSLPRQRGNCSLNIYDPCFS